MKLKKSNLQTRIVKYNTAINLRAISGISLIEAHLKKIKLAKEMFILEIEDNKEVIIPQVLGQTRLPLSFKFYDPILAIVNEGVSSETRKNIG